MGRLKKVLEEFSEELRWLIKSGQITEDDRPYFEGKLFAYECVLEMLDKETE